MAEEIFDALKTLDRDALVIRMAEELPSIRRELHVTEEALAEKTGVGEARIRAAEKGDRSFKWSEYLSILFVIWNNDIGKGLLDDKGLFPAELKKALSVNRNAHAPETEYHSSLSSLPIKNDI